MRPLIRRLVLACAIVFGFLSLVRADPGAVQAERASSFRVGHTIMQVIVTDSDIGKSESRAVNVHLWYPAENQGFFTAPKTRYSSALYGLRLIPAKWDPLSWSVEAEIAREGVPIDSHGPPFPVLVFSHGSTNDPFDYAYTLERIAGEGFVVAAPSHTANTQDDVRIDYINGLAGADGPVFSCNDGPTVADGKFTPRKGPCSPRPGGIARSMRDRVRDITAVLNSLQGPSGWLGDRADVDRAGVFGHSRGSVTALASAGGSTAWGIGTGTGTGISDLDPRVKAVMGLAIGAPNVTFAVNLANITVPTLLVAGTLDAVSPQEVSEAVFEQISSDEKLFVSVQGAHHRSFSSANCNLTQSAGAIAQAAGTIDPATTRAVLDLHMMIHLSTGGLTGFAGSSTDYCRDDTFVNPVDIRPITSALSGFNFTTDSVPTTGLDTDEVKEGVTEMAVAFFGTILKRAGDNRIHFSHYLSPKWLVKHEAMVSRAEAFARADALCPPGQDVNCEF